jgi:hypothetical protein
MLKKKRNKLTKRRRKTKIKTKTKKKIYKEYGPGLRYLIFDGEKHVFKFIG